MYDDYVSDRPLYPPALKRSLFFTKETCRRVLFGIDSCHRDVVILYCIEGYARKFFWQYFDLAPYTKSPYFIGIVFVFAVVVFLFCILLNELRRLLFDRIDGALAALIMKPVNACTPALINGYRRAHDGMVQFLRKK